MSTLATWDKITGALGSTTTTFGGEWGNLISDFMNGVDIGLSDPNKRPRPNTLTRFKHEKLGMFDGDESHYIVFSPNDIDTGGVRKIIIRRMNSPNETDYMVMENMTQELLGKTINFNTGVTGNSATNIPTGAILDAAITTIKINDGAVNSNKLADNAVTNVKMANDSVGTAEIIDANVTLAKLTNGSSFLLNSQDNSLGAHYLDITRMTAPTDPAANNARLFVEQIDSNNDGVFTHIKKNGSFQKVQLI